MRCAGCHLGGGRGGAKWRDTSLGLALCGKGVGHRVRLVVEVGDVPDRR
jgi:hypothetical protein